MVLQFAHNTSCIDYSCSNLTMVEMIDGPLFLLCTYSLSLLLLQENGHDEICIKAMGRAINKTVMVVELIKVG